MASCCSSLSVAIPNCGSISTMKLDDISASSSADDTGSQESKYPRQYTAGYLSSSFNSSSTLTSHNSIFSPLIIASCSMSYASSSLDWIASTDTSASSSPTLTTTPSFVTILSKSRE